MTGLPSADVVAGDSVHATQTGIPGTAKAASVTVNSQWSDGAQGTQTGSVELAGTCASVQPHAIPVAPAFHEGTCTESPSMEIPPATDDYDVQVEGTAGFGDTVTVTFVAKGDVVLDGQTVFNHTFQAQPEDSATTTTTTTPGDDSTTTTTVEKTLTFQVLGPICVADHPYIHWELTATGLLPTQNLATITITDVNGNVVETLTNQPLVGSTLWPGASLDPEDWPGWVKIGGVWYSDPSDAVLRQGVYVRADINPTAGPLFVAYPEATAACAQPTPEVDGRDRDHDQRVTAGHRHLEQRHVVDRRRLPRSRWSGPDRRPSPSARLTAGPH